MNPLKGVVHWDEVERRRSERGEMAATWRMLGRAAGTRAVGINRIEIDPGRLSTPPHSHSVSEEIFFVLGGSGLSWQDEAVYEVRAGDCIVHVADHEEHTLRAGPDGLDVLVFGTRHPAEYGWLPRSHAVRSGYVWVEGRTDDPWELEAQAEPLDFSTISPRPANILNVDECADYPEEIHSKELAGTAGSVETGLNWVDLKAGEHSSVFHCHSREEEIFVVLAGEGTLELWASPISVERGATERVDVPVRTGHVIARPPGTRVSHRFTAGESGMRMLVYGTRELDDVAYYPHSKKLFFRGVGVIVDAEHVPYG
jgi:uncharacterized cupin superfamily protein